MEITDGLEWISGKDICAVIPTAGKRLEYLSRAIDSVTQQSEECGEIIVVWDSSDVIPDDIAKNERVKVIRNSIENRGVAGARNTAIEATNLTYIALLDDDDTWFPEKIAKYIQEINAGMERGFYVSRGRYVDKSGHFLGVFPSKRFNLGVTLSAYLNNNIHVRRRRISIPTSSYVFPKVGPSGINKFNKEIIFAEDILLLLQLDKTLQFKIVGDEPLSETTIYRSSEEGLSKRPIHFEDWIQICRSHFSFLASRQFDNMILYFGIHHFRKSYGFTAAIKWLCTYGRTNADLVTYISTLSWLITNELQSLYVAVFGKKTPNP
jgi:glycosyltransferase involved in cell wall biosynthesis